MVRSFAQRHFVAGQSYRLVTLLRDAQGLACRVHTPMQGPDEVKYCRHPRINTKAFLLREFFGQQRSAVPRRQSRVPRRQSRVVRRQDGAVRRNARKRTFRTLSILSSITIDHLFSLSFSTADTFIQSPFEILIFIIMSIPIYSRFQDPPFYPAAIGACIDIQ